MLDITVFQKETGYRFRDEALLLQALTHRSYANECKKAHQEDNERLEFLGDAVLELVSSDILYHTYPDWPEGKLTKCRASIVCEQTLAFCCRRLNLGRYLYLGKGEEMTGGRNRPSILSDALEAVIGAIWLDGGLAPARTFIETHIMYDIENMQLFYDSKTILQEMVQGSKGGQPDYVLVSAEGPDHAKSYLVEVRIAGKVCGAGTGHTKKAAEQEAAYQAILKCKKDREA